VLKSPLPATTSVLQPPIVKPWTSATVARSTALQITATPAHVFSSTKDISLATRGAVSAAASAPTNPTWTPANTGGGNMPVILKKTVSVPAAMAAPAATMTPKVDSSGSRQADLMENWVFVLLFVVIFSEMLDL